MSKKKRLFYIIAAVVLIVAGLYLNRGDEDLDLDLAESSYLDQSESGQGYEVRENETEDGADYEENITEDYVSYYFRNDDLLEQHYKKHVMEMGFESMEEYEEAACAVIYHPDVLSKTEKEDGDYVYYIEESNEFVVLSKDGYIRTYFNPSAGIEYYNRQ